MLNIKLGFAMCLLCKPHSSPVHECVLNSIFLIKNLRLRERICLAQGYSGGVMIPLCSQIPQVGLQGLCSVHSLLCLWRTLETVCDPPILLSSEASAAWHEWLPPAPSGWL